MKEKKAPQSRICEGSLTQKTQKTYKQHQFMKKPFECKIFHVHKSIHKETYFGRTLIVQNLQKQSLELQNGRAQ